MHRPFIFLFFMIQAALGAWDVVFGQELTFEKDLRSAVEGGRRFVIIQNDSSSVAYLMGFVEGHFRLTLDKDIRQALRGWGDKGRLFAPLFHRQELCAQNAKTFMDTGSLPFVNDMISREKTHLNEMIRPAVEAQLDGDSVYVLEYSFVREQVILNKFSTKGILIWKKHIDDGQIAFLEGAKRFVAGIAMNTRSVFVISIQDDRFTIEEINKNDGSRSGFLNVELETTSGSSPKE